MRVRFLLIRLDILCEGWGGARSHKGPLPILSHVSQGAAADPSGQMDGLCWGSNMIFSKVSASGTDLPGRG